MKVSEHKHSPLGKLVFGIAGASGAPIALALLGELSALPITIYLVFTETGAKVFELETGIRASKDDIVKAIKTEKADESAKISAKIHQYESTNFFAPPASGTHLWDAMVICPASAGICGKIAAGIGDDLVARCADIAIKENRKLILVVRESPMSAVLLENLLRLSRLGVRVIPPVLTFYHEPKDMADQITFWVTKVLDELGITSSLIRRWGDEA